MVKKKLAPKAWAERIRLPRFIGLLMTSAPMAKYQRMAAELAWPGPRRQAAWRVRGPPPRRPPEQRFRRHARSAEHTSELQSLMRTTYAVLCLKQQTTTKHSSYYH